MAWAKKPSAASKPGSCEVTRREEMALTKGA